MSPARDMEQNWHLSDALITESYWESNHLSWLEEPEIVNVEDVAILLMKNFIEQL